jgi:hypothetical protein
MTTDGRDPAATTVAPRQGFMHDRGPESGFGRREHVSTGSTSASRPSRRRRPQWGEPFRRHAHHGRPMAGVAHRPRPVRDAASGRRNRRITVFDLAMTPDSPIRPSDEVRLDVTVTDRNSKTSTALWGRGDRGGTTFHRYFDQIVLLGATGAGQRLAGYDHFDRSAG